MSSLYRKWRSRSFEDLVGQEHVVRTLRNAVAHDRVAHAYLFTGPRGTGKTSAARILAKALNCLHPDQGNPCNTCDMCIAANEGRAMDVVEIDAASNTSVENVRDLRERVGYAASAGRFKVYIVDEVHRLSGAAFDAFLKTLEEPPPHVVFVFASTEPQKVPATIMSRCQRFDFRRIAPDVMADRIRFVAAAEELSVQSDALALIVLNAKGSLRDALGLLDQISAFTSGVIEPEDVRSALGLADPLLVSRMSEALIAGDVGNGLADLQTFLECGGDPGQLGSQLIEYWRNVLLRCVGAPEEATSIDPALADSLTRHARLVDKAKAVSVVRMLASDDFGTKFDIPTELPLQVAYLQAALVFSEPEHHRTARNLPASPVTQSAPPPETTLPGGSRPSIVPSSSSPDPEKPTVRPAPEAETETTPERPTPIVGQNHDAHDLPSAWDSVVASMRSKSPSLQAILRSGYLMRLNGGEMVVGFLYEFHRNAFSDPKKRKLLEEVVADVFGVPYRVTCVRTTKDEVGAITGALPDDDGFVDEASERLREFHAKQLGNGSS